MKNQWLKYFILMAVIGAVFFACEGMAELFHGPRPEPAPETYIVTFNANGGSGTPPQEMVVNPDAIINLPGKGNLSSGENIFGGWSESSAGTSITYSVGSTVKVTRNMAFYAQWLDGSTPPYTVTFNANGASSGAAPASQTAYSGTSITIPGSGTLAYSSKIFSGWNTLANGEGTNYEAGSMYTVTGNVTLYAKWNSASQYTVTFNANGATSGTAPVAQTVNHGTQITIPEAGTLTYSGRTFGGWNTQPNGDGTNYEAGSMYTVTGNVTLYAKWNSASQYTVTFNANGASGTAPAAQTVDMGAEITLPEAGTLTYSGRTFGGWNTQANGEGTNYEAGSMYTVTGNVTLYAKWNSASQYTVTFNANGASGTAPDAQTVDAGIEVTLPGVGNLTYSGRTFGGWNTQSGGEGTNYEAGATYTVNGNITLYAKWINIPSIIEMSWISAGTYTRGSSNSLDSGASPPHQVTLTKGFYMGIYEVTQEQYQAVMGINPSSFSSNPASGEVQERRPVEQVTWYDAVEFCNKLSEQEGLTPAYTITGRSPSSGYPITNATVAVNWNASGYRLPTEAEWEYACRAGTTTAYNTGETITDNTGWYVSNSGSRTHEVGKKPANAWGLYDMHGNVWEWCWDWQGNYSSTSQTDPRGAVSGIYRVIRGGSWNSNEHILRSASRGGDNPISRSDYIGFRLLRP